LGPPAEELKLQEQMGKINARVNSQEAGRRADDLQARLQKRMEQLDREARSQHCRQLRSAGWWLCQQGYLQTLPGGRLQHRHTLWRPKPLAPALVHRHGG